MIRRTLTFAAVLLIAASAHATTVLKVGLKKMTLTSDVIIHGFVETSTPVAVNNNERHIRTDVTIRIHALLKGPRAMKQIKLELPGGSLGKWAMRIPGMPRFVAGEEVVLFLEKTSVNWAITGLAQGKYHVFKSADGRKLVKRNMDGLHFVNPHKGGHKAPVAREVKTTQTLDGLLAEIRHTLKESKVQK